MSYTEIMAYIVLLWIVTDDGVEVMSQFENLYLIFFFLGRTPSLILQPKFLRS